MSCPGGAGPLRVPVPAAAAVVKHRPRPRHRHRPSAHHPTSPPAQRLVIRVVYTHFIRDLNSILNKNFAHKSHF